MLHRSGIRVLGTLHGLRVGDFAWEKNCGLKTLDELDSLGADAVVGMAVYTELLAV